jgi:Uma2 family endonuclease
LADVRTEELLMASVITPSSAITTVADLLRQLGDIPPERVRLRPVPGTATEKDVIEVEARENRICELVDGVLVEKAMGYYESRLAAILIYFLESFLNEHDLGVTAGADGMLRLAAGLVRIPDVSFVSWDRLAGHDLPAEPIPDLAPDLAVEVLSESNTAREMTRKVAEYFRAGTRLVWLADPKTRTVRVYTSPGRSKLLREDQTLDGGTVLPGFSPPLAQWFARASRSRR